MEEATGKRSRQEAKLESMVEARNCLSRQRSTVTAGKYLRRTGRRIRGTGQG